MRIFKLHKTEQEQNKSLSMHDSIETKKKGTVEKKFRPERSFVERIAAAYLGILFTTRQRGGDKNKNCRCWHNLNRPTMTAPE